MWDIIAALLLLASPLAPTRPAEAIQHPTWCHERRLPKPGNAPPSIDELLALDDYCGGSYGHWWRGGPLFVTGRTSPTIGDSAAASQVDSGPPPTLAEVLVQWTALVATALVVGGLAFRAWALEPAVRHLRTGVQNVATVPNGLDDMTAEPGLPSPVTAAAQRTLRWSLWLLAFASLAELVASLGLLAAEPPLAALGLNSIGKASALALLRFALTPMIGYLAVPNGSLGMALAFGGILVLTRSQAGHAAIYGLGTVLLDAVHQGAAAVWLGGGAALIALDSAIRKTDGLAKLVLARFARLAAVAAGLVIATGPLHAWALGQDLASLGARPYDLALIAKVVTALLLLGVAFFVWRLFRRGAGELARAALAIELGVGGAVLVAASSLALLPPPPSLAAGRPLELVRLAGDDFVVLELSDVDGGEIRASARVVDRAGNAVAASAGRFNVVSLETEAETTSVAAMPTDGAVNARLSPPRDPGWWRLTAAIEIGPRTVTVSYELLAPDPNRSPRDPRSAVADPSAQRVFGETVQRMMLLRAATVRDVLGDGVGGVLASTTAATAPAQFRATIDGGVEVHADGTELVAVRAGQAPRTVRRSVPFEFPSFRQTYAGAVGQRLGRQELLAGIPVQVVTFAVPGDQAWYCWWVGRDDGLVHREAVIAPAHYQVSELSNFQI